MKFIALLSLFLSLFLSLTSYGKCKPITIAVLDTGFGYGVNRSENESIKFCKTDHRNFTIDDLSLYVSNISSTIPFDTNSHGTNIVGIINDRLKNTDIDYCIIVIKYYSSKQTNTQNLNALIKSINYAANIHANYVNISGGGPISDLEEFKATERYLNQGNKMIVAAMNYGKDIDLPENYVYPASYDKRIIVVGNMCEGGIFYKNPYRCESSNWGERVDRWEFADSVTALGITMGGTSQATAIATSKIVAEDQVKCDIGNKRR